MFNWFLKNRVKTYRLLISFEEVNCLGEQLAMLLEHSKSLVNGGVWYACDVDTICDNLKIEHLMDYYPKKIGSVEDLIDLANGIQQFIWGLFFLMPTDCGDQLDVKYSNEDEQFRDFGKAILEIRAFDTTWLMVYSKDRKIIEGLKERFNGEVSVK